MKVNFVFFEMSFSIEGITNVFCDILTESESIVNTQRIFVQRFRKKINWEEKVIFMQDGAQPHWSRTVR